MADRPAATPVLVLASASPRRQELLRRLGVTPVIRPVDLDETAGPDEPAVDLAIRLAVAKADAGADAGITATTASGTPVDRHDEVVLAADTVVVLDGRALGKPRDRDDARAMLEALAGRTHEVVTGIAVRHGALRRHGVVHTQVTVRPLSGAEIDWYLATGEPDDKAGAYGLQGAGAALVARIDGSDTNVIGLPLAETITLLREAGLDLLRPDRPPATRAMRAARRSPRPGWSR